MTRTTPTAPAPMFNGVGRSHRILDLATVALCLSFIGGFLAHTATPTSAVARRGTLIAATVQPQAQVAR